MAVLYWIFSNDHRWQKPFDTVEAAQRHAEICGFFSNPCINRAWIETESESICLKEK
jgi:hypothetical protein